MQYERIITPGHYDVHERLRQLDADGVAAGVIFHGSQNGEPLPFAKSSGSFGSRAGGDDARSMELSQQGVSIYNRWLADFCSVQPERHVGLAQLPIWDVGAAVKEVERASAAGLRGVNFPAPRPSLPDYNDPVWEPFWSVCEDNNMPLETHGGSHTIIDNLAKYTGPGAMRIRHFDQGRLSSRGLWWLILGGVFARHPKLKFVLTEHVGVISWMPSTLMELDALAASSRWDSSGLSKSPSEYFASNCFVGASFMSNAEALLAIEGGFAQTYLWGSDYPHLEGTYPWSKLSLRMTLGGVQPEIARRIVGLNLVDVFGLDRGALQSIANRVGPTIAELMTPLTADEMPTDPNVEFSQGFRRGIWGQPRAAQTPPLVDRRD
jgi:predicted TIM-barrel fold metal-dependent hydrolase